MSETAPTLHRRDYVVRDFLDGLGTTADEVAASLLAMGVTGVRKSYNDCPIARALKAAFPDVTYVSVAGRRVYVEFGITEPAVTVAQPDAVVALVDGFDDDDCAYPQLVAEIAQAVQS